MRPYISRYRIPCEHVKRSCSMMAREGLSPNEKSIALKDLFDFTLRIAICLAITRNQPTRKVL